MSIDRKLKERKQATPDQVLRVLKGRKGKGIDTDELSETLRSGKRSVVVAIKSLIKSGYLVSERGGSYYIDSDQQPGKYEFEYKSRADGKYKFGFSSDQHIASKYSRIDVLEDLYDKFAEQKVDRVINCGNWIDGEARFNKHDLLYHGLDNQVGALVDLYPHRAGIKTYAVAGDDHEGWIGQREGIDIGKYAENAFIESGRTDWIDTGYMESYMNLVHRDSGKTSKLLMMHPGGGSAHAISWRPQKIVESLSGGEKPSVLLIGHYHKLSYNVIRNVHAIQSGCFSGNTPVETPDGPVCIRDIKVGDYVMTHVGRYRKVTKTMRREHSDTMVSVNYSRIGRLDQTITATPEHPILVKRGSEIAWIPIAEIVEGDLISTLASKCKVCSDTVPYWMNLCRNCNPMDMEDTRLRASTSRGFFCKKRSGVHKHLNDDIIPFCKQMSDEGWTMVPTGGSVVPDAIGFNGDRVVAFELESHMRGSLGEFKKSKYESSYISDWIDGVEWVDLAPRIEQPRSFYEADGEFCWVKVVSSKTHYLCDRKRKRMNVYNLSVDEDESYVAGRIAVHNCTEDQTPFMRKKGIDAHVGGGICELTQDAKTGAITSCKVEFFCYYNEGYYNNRWSHSGSVTHPKRGLYGRV
jgi:hypothetical protein